MTITVTSLTSGSAASYQATTSTISPTSTPVVVFVAQATSNPLVSTDMSVSGCGLSWTRTAWTAYASRRGLWLFVGTGTPSAGTLTLTGYNAGSSNGIAWSVFELDGVASLGTVAADEDSGTSATVTLSGTPGSLDATLAAVGIEGDYNPTWESGYNEIHDVSESGNVRRLTTGWDAEHDSTPSASWSSSEGWGMLALYLVAESGGGGSTYNDSISLGRAAGVSQAPGLALAAALTLARSAGLSQVGDVEAAASTVTKTFVFLSDAEGFSGVAGGSGVSMAWIGTDGNPAGCLRSALTSASLTRVNYWEWVGTWEDLGVPSGATVTHARLNSGYWKCSNYSKAGSGNKAGPYRIFSNDGTPVQIAEIWAGANVSGTTSWQSISAQSDQTISSSYQASDTTIRIRLYDTQVTITGAGPNVTLLDDQVSLVITYTAGGGGGSTYENSISLARAGGLSDAAGMALAAALTLARAGGLSQANGLAAAAALALARAAGLSQANVMTMQAAIALNKVGGVGPGSVMTLGEALTLSKVTGLSSAGGMDVFDGLTLARALGLNTLSGMSVAAVMSLGRAMGLSDAAGLALAAALTLARAAGAGAGSRLDASGQVGLSKSLGVSGSAGGVYGVVLDLARAMGAALAAGLECDEAIGLGLALALMGGAGAAPVTPGSRIYTVNGETRVLIVPAEGRVYVVDAEGRVTVIEV